MKKILTIALIALMSLTSAGAAVKKDGKKDKKIEITTFKTDIDCDHCVKKIMDTMPFKKGVKSVKVDLPKKEVSITYDSKKNNSTELIEGFKKIDIEAKVLKPDSKK